MASPDSLQPLGNRPFRFAPAIAGIDHNEWILESSSWSEIQVRNMQSGESVWLPRQFVGEIIDASQGPTVALVRPLEYSIGAIRAKRNSLPTEPQPSSSADPKPVPTAGKHRSVAHPADRMATRVLTLAVSVCLAIGLLVVGISYWRQNHVQYKPVLQMDPGLTVASTRSDVIQRFGAPAKESFAAKTNAIQFQILDYPEQDLRAVLFGADRKNMFYIGLVNQNGSVVHSVKISKGQDSRSLLRMITQR